MRARADSALLSSVAFTIALLFLIPAFWANLSIAPNRSSSVVIEAGYAAAARSASDLSVASLAIILIGLMVTWTVYVKRARWAWAVMFVVVWAWAFPLLVMPLFQGKLALTLPEWLYDALSEAGSPRMWAESIFTFTLMVFALVLPMRSLFLAGMIRKPIYRLTPRRAAFSVTGVLVILASFLAWVRLGVLYEIPSSQLNTTQRLPAPLPPGQ
jgi:hypothetical protein